MIRKFKKIAIIFLATIIIFTGSIAIPHEQQKAHAISIPIALQGAAGVYVIGGLLVAGGLGAVGYDEYGDEIKAHSLRAWDNATQISKDSINWTIEAATGLGNGIVTLQGDFINFIDGKLSEIGASSYEMTHGNINSDGVYVGKSSFDTISFNNAELGVEIYHKGQFVQSVGVLDFGQNWLQSTYKTLSGETITSERIYYTAAEKKIFLAERALVDSIPELQRLLSKWVNLSFMYGTAASPFDMNLYENGLSKIREQWETMRDAGLVLPVDSFVPTTAAGEPLTYNPATGELTGIDGGVYTGEHTWQIPNVSWRDKSAAVPETGLWVETPVAIPGVGVGNPAIPNTITNITTGTTVLNPDIPIEGDLPGGGTPPPAETENPWNRPPTKKPPNIGALVTTKFPFSLPFDFFGVLGWLNAEPKAPVFKLDTGLNTPFGNELKMDMEFKFDFLDPYMGYFRSFIIIGFSLFLILATRKLMGGAG